MSQTNGNGTGKRLTAATNPAGSRPATVSRPTALRAKTTNDPLHGRVSRNTAQGRRIADLFDSFPAAMDNPTDPLAQADALTAAELRVAAEDARKQLLHGININPEGLVKLENAARRAEKKLNLRARSERKPTIQEHLASRRQSREVAP